MFHGKKGGQHALFEIFTGAPPTPKAFGIFLHEVIIIRVWSWFFALCNHGEDCCAIAMGLGRRLPRSGITKYSAGGVVALLSYLSQSVMHFLLLGGGPVTLGVFFPLNYIWIRECMGWNEMELS